MDESSTSTYHSLARMDIPSISNADLKFMVQLTEDDDELGKIAQEDVTETICDEVFASYAYKEIIPGCKPHPGDIVEAGSLAHLSPPDATYPLKESLPDEIITEGKLSSLQLTGVLYACQRHQLILPNGTRAGFFIGDAAGVGKGRQIAGIMLDNFARGRTKHIWFSISADLIVDARRDLSDIGCHVKVIEGAQQLDKETRIFGLPSDFREGVVFSTYATLVSSVQKGGAFNSMKQSRLQQLVNWCGGSDFEGCLVFDECHKAKNFVPGKEQNSTKVALAVATLQRLLPKARVVYCSATGVSDVKNMAFMERLGLWGDGAPFRNFQQFLDTVQKKGLGVAEMLAMEMKSSGMYVCRSLSFKQAEFTTVEIPLTKETTRMYNTAAHVWGELARSLTAAVDRTGQNNKRVWSSYWAAHQRFFRQLCMGIKVPTIIAEAKAALESGHSVVIGLQTTGEASLESELNQSKKPLSDWVSLCREILFRFIQQHFPTALENPPSAGPTEDEWSVTAKQLLLGFAQQIPLPNSPLDEIIRQLGGPDRVAEMTGRRGRMVQRSPDEPPKYELRDSEANGGVESLNVQERNEFMEGRKFVAIISDAASTGISLHADERVANQRRRVHMTIELPWSADKAVQQLGRSHRSNQTSGPLYKLMTTTLGGERRFASAVARRLQSLGALTKGDRRAATGVDLMEFNFDTPYGRLALKAMFTAICTNTLPPSVPLSAVAKDMDDFAAFNDQMLDCLKVMDLMEVTGLVGSQKVKDADARDVPKFLNRILGLSVDRQNKIFTYFSICLDAQINMARKEGRYNEGLVDIVASSVQMKIPPKQVLRTDASCNPTSHIVLQVDRGMTWEKAQQRLSHYPDQEAGNGFYRSKREMWGQRLVILATLKQGSKHSFKIARPNTGIFSFDEEKADLLRKYVPISIEDAEQEWQNQYARCESRCVHGPHCKASRNATCTVGCRVYEMHLLCGGIVTMMSLLETTILRFSTQLSLSKYECALRVVRVKLDNGERVVGIRYPEILIPEVEKAIQEQRDSSQMLLGSNSSDSAQSSSVLGLQKPVGPSYLEPVATVKPKCLQKAMTPPLTIKTFFKPSNGVLKSEESNNCEKEPENCSSSQSIKRPSFKSPPVAKRQKQSNIMASFAQAEKKERLKRTCPICQKEFPATAMNTEINKHIDNCLIE